MCIRDSSHVVPVTGFVTAGHVVQKAGTYVYENESMSTPIQHFDCFYFAVAILTGSYKVLDTVDQFFMLGINCFISCY